MESIIKLSIYLFLSLEISLFHIFDDLNMFRPSNPQLSQWSCRVSLAIVAGIPGRPLQKKLNIRVRNHHLVVLHTALFG
jgi:hypothetical protein